MGQKFGQHLKSRVTELKLSGYKIAKMAGVSHPHFYNMVNGKTEPGDEVLAKLAPVLELPVATLQAWADEDRLGGKRALNLARRVLWDSPGKPAPPIPMPRFVPNTFNRLVCMRLEAIGKTPGQAATEAGIDPKELYRLFRTKRHPSLDLIVKLAPILGFKPETLQSWADEDRLNDARAPELVDQFIQDRIVGSRDISSILGALADWEANEEALLERGAILQAWEEEDCSRLEQSPDLVQHGPAGDSAPEDFAAETSSPPSSYVPTGVPRPGASPQVVQAIEWLNALPPEERLAELRYLEQRVRHLQRERDLAEQDDKKSDD